MNLISYQCQLHFSTFASTRTGPMDTSTAYGGRRCVRTSERPCPRLRREQGTLNTFSSAKVGSPARLNYATQALAARADCWLAICSFIFFCISLGVGCAMWAATIQM